MTRPIKIVPPIQTNVVNNITVESGVAGNASSSAVGAPLQYQALVTSDGRLWVNSAVVDSLNNRITSQASGSQRALDVGVNVAGVQIDPRVIRTLTTADQVTAFQGGGSWTAQLVDNSGNNVTVKQLSNQVVAADYGLVTNSVIHGLTTGGGGGYVDVKVSPSGAIQVGGTIDAVTAITNPVTVTGTVTANQGGAPWTTIPTIIASGSGTIAGNGQTLDITTSGAATVMYDVSGAYTGLIATQASVDGVNFRAISGYSTTNGNFSTAPTANVVAVSCAGYKIVRLVGFAWGAGTATIAWQSTPGTVYQQVANSISYPLYASLTDGKMTTYSAAVSALAPATLATDIFTITGSGSKVVRVTRLEISGTQTTSGSARLFLLRRSTANTGGTSSAPTVVHHDSTNAAATATLLSYTANPTTGTLVGNLRTERILLTGAGTAGVTVSWTFGDRPAQGILLRSTSEVLAVNLNGVTFAGASFDISVEWTESTT